MDTTNFTNVLSAIAAGNINFTTHTYKIMLISTNLVQVNIDSMVHRSDVINEAVGTGYTSGGIALNYLLGSLDTTNKRLPVIWQNIVDGWVAATLNFVGAIIYRNTGSAATDLLVQYIDFGGAQSATASNINISFTTPLYINSVTP